MACWPVAAQSHPGAISSTPTPGPVRPAAIISRNAAQEETGSAADISAGRGPRRTLGLALVRNGWAYNCMECHTLLAARWHYDRPVTEHFDLRLDHGSNRFCLTCHHPANRNAFVDFDGTEISERDVAQLCGKCHGPTYRDWRAGAHGREQGFWKVSFGEKTRLLCIECHDPHRPKIQPVRPLAPLRYPKRGAYPRGHAGPDVASHRDAAASDAPPR